MARPKNIENRSYGIIIVGDKRVVYDAENKNLGQALKKLARGTEMTGELYKALQEGEWLSV